VLTHPVRLSALRVVIGLLAGCASEPQITSITAPTASLSSYKTYGFVAQPGTNRGGNATPLTTYFETSISTQMDARGYRKVDANPELLVNFDANVIADVESIPGPMIDPDYYGYRRGLYGGGLDAPLEIEMVHYKEGTANINVVDASKRTMVWEAQIQHELTGAAMQNPQATVDKAVTNMFTRFPHL
jgi:hypothetical protein